MLVAGVDPGATGGWAVLDTETNSLWQASRIDRDNMPRLYRCLKPCQIILIERAQASPQMGHSSAFEYGRTFGRIEAACQMTTADILYIGAAVWKAWLHIPADKRIAMAIAIDKFPGLRQFINSEADDGVAEATLIGSVLLSEKLKAQVIRNNQATAKPKRKRASYSL